MMSRRCSLTRVCLTVGLLLSSLSAAAVAQDWTTINKDYSSQRYVDLDQITPENVGELEGILRISAQRSRLV